PRAEPSVGAAIRLARLRRQRVPVTRNGLAAECGVHLVDGEAVQATRLGQHAARFGHQLGADPVAGEASDAVALRPGAHRASARMPSRNLVSKIVLWWGGDTC